MIPERPPEPEMPRLAGLQRLAHVGFGRVYRAGQVSVGRYVAVKVLTRTEVTESAFRP